MALTISSASVNSTGKTVTVTIAGASGNLTPTTGITGFYVRQVVGEVLISIAVADATASGANNIILNLDAVVQSTGVVTVFTYQTNLTDVGSSNVMDTTVTAANSSTVVPSISGTTGLVGYQQYKSEDTASFAAPIATFGGGPIDFQVNATACYFGYRATAGVGITCLKVSVDNGAYVNVVNSGDQFEYAKLFEGLSAGVHTISIEPVTSTGILMRDMAIMTLGGTGVVSQPQGGVTHAPASWATFYPAGFDQKFPVGAGLTIPSWYNPEGGASTVDNGPDSFRIDGSGNFLQNASDARNVTIIMQGKISSFIVKTYSTGQMSLRCDNRDLGVVNTVDASPSAFDFTGVDTSVSHIWVLEFLVATNLEWIMTTGGTGLSNTAPPPRPLFKGIGHSQMQGDAGELGYVGTPMRKFGLLKNVAVQNRGIGGTKVYNSGGDTQAGEYRAVRELGPCSNGQMPAGIVFLHGINDIGQSWTVTQFEGAFYRMVKGSFDAGIGTNVVVLVMSLLPTYNYPVGTMAPYQAAIVSAIGNTGDSAGHALTTAQQGQIKYDDTSTYGLAGNSGTNFNNAVGYLGPGVSPGRGIDGQGTGNFYDGLHPNDTGNAILANRIVQAFFSTSAPVSSVSGTQIVAEFDLIGLLTNWSGEPFAIISGGGALTLQSVTDTTHAHIKITGGASPWRISDGARTFVVGVAGSGRGGTGIGI